MSESKKAELKAWLASFSIHLAIIILFAVMGVFNMNKVSEVKDIGDVVWIENASGDAGDMDDGAAGNSVAAVLLDIGFTEASIETAVTIPLDEKQQEKQLPQDKPQKITAASTNQQPTDNSSASPASTTQSTANNGNGSGSGEGESDNGIESGNGEGNGSGKGNAGVSGIGSSPSERAEAVCTYKAAPIYPNRMKEMGIGGRVVLEICVAPDDSVENVEVIQSSGHGTLDNAAIEAAYKCRFSMNGLWGKYTLSYVFEVVDDDW